MRSRCDIATEKVARQYGSLKYEIVHDKEYTPITNPFIYPL